MERAWGWLRPYLTLSKSKDERQGLNNLRIGLSTVILAHHAGLPYGNAGPWIFVSEHQTNWLGGFFALSEAFAVPVFFTLSGYFTELSLQRTKPWAFWKSRFKRLMTPLFTMLHVVNPACYFLAYRVHSQAPDAKTVTPLQFYIGHWLGLVRPKHFYWHNGHLSFPLASKIHMWFVETLLGLTAVWTILRPLVLRLEDMWRCHRGREDTCSMTSDSSSSGSACCSKNGHSSAASALGSARREQAPAPTTTRTTRATWLTSPEATEARTTAEARDVTQQEEDGALVVLDNKGHQLHEARCREDDHGELRARGEGSREHPERSHHTPQNNEHAAVTQQPVVAAASSSIPAATTTELLSTWEVWRVALLAGAAAGVAMWLVRIRHPLDEPLNLAITNIKPARYPQYVLNFGLGVAFARLGRTLKTTQRAERVSLAVTGAWTVAFLVGRAKIEGQHALIDSFKGGATWHSLALSTVEAVVCMHATFGLLSASMRHASYENTLTRKLSSATFGVYVLHLPVVMFWQTVFQEWPMHGSLKWVCVTLLSLPTSFGLSLATRRVPGVSTCLGLGK